MSFHGKLLEAQINIPTLPLSQTRTQTTDNRYKMSSSDCTQVGPNCPADGSGLSYPPSLVASIIFSAIFGVSLAFHLFLGVKFKTWSFLACYLLGSTAEAAGYIGRIFLHSNPYNLNTLVVFLIGEEERLLILLMIRFLVQIVSLTMGPAFYSAGLYLCLARMYSPFSISISAFERLI